MATEKRRLPPPTASEAAFDALLARFDAPLDERLVASVEEPVHASGSPDPAFPGDPDAFFEHLFANADAYADRDRYATIGDATEFRTKVVGVTFEGRQDSVAGMRPGALLELQRDPANAHDPNAVGVWYGGLQLGFIKADIARRIAPKIDDGARYAAEVLDVTGGGTRSYGINILVRRTDLETAFERPLVAAAATVAREDIVRALIGDRPIRDSQRAVLERIDARKNTLAVLGTGRGKSFCFQYPAAARALENGERTLVLYPLRALANDQFDALLRRLGPLGLRIFRANGSIGPGERSALLAALESGAWDIICATPEFAQYHIERFAAHPPGLVVIDEAHHLFESTHRAAYTTLPATIARLGKPQIVALTATADDEAFAHLRATLGIEAWVIDPTVRANLTVVEARNTTNKRAYIEARVREPGKSIIYCNSRAAATKEAERLRGKLGNEVAFYHAGVPSAERQEIERLFREGIARVVVATSAFGEGIDLPDVRHVFLYHLNFNFTEFNQQSGRAGRDEQPAEIHLLFGKADRSLNDFIIDRQAPTLATLRTLYREMKKLARDEILRMTGGDVADTLQLDRVDHTTVETAMRIFEEAGLLVRGDDEEGRFVRFVPVEGKVDLGTNARFAEGEAEREDFSRFYELAINAQPEDLERIINRPIYPSNVPLIR
jgi:single-stranded-DNA-specific exonuclease